MTTTLPELYELPEGFLDASPQTLHECVPEPTLIHLEGQRAPALAVVLLLHGNEPVGLQAVQRLLRRYTGRTLPRALTLMVGNPRAAAVSQRHLDEQPDFNRIWPGTEQSGSPEAECFAETCRRLEQRGLFAAIDLHNNTGRNPHYACINHLEPAFMNLAALFGRTVVYFTRPRGVASMALARIAPSVTLECGPPNDEAGIQHAFEMLDAVLHLDHFPEHPPRSGDIDIFHTVAQVRVRPGLQAGLDAQHDVRLEPDLDRLNFQLLPAHSTLVHIRPEVDSPLVAIAEDGREVTEEYLETRGDEIRLKRAAMPSMLTLDSRVIAQDCLCYLMEPLALP
ncbi:succinylglutamate desuccinylase/aspartoacylase [Thioalkalivibrio sp. K90mix]|uniref:M14 family metallopeptidase n=1 Tax=Thioalkalivibrio sp. (strain K90mix) TaxID=396595 RepID=UPI0001959AEE|nr:M14 family metallopeptidase [Thioalkalivibrio sp. K90mix]ADC72796.1 succinylglutamate desuccinylase/aspartoacylase [Thioalkalivibrio sp. K90mix]